MQARTVLWMLMATGALSACRKDAPAVEAVANAAQPASQPKEAAAAEPFGRLTVDEVEARLKDPGPKGKLHIFDANGRSRYDQSHVPTAQWVKFNELKESDLPPQKDAPLVFYCANEH